MAKKTASGFGKKYVVTKGLSRRLDTLDGLPIVNATKSIDLVVKNSDIKGSRSKDPDRCAAAVACARQFKASEVRVHLGRTYIRHGQKWVRYMTGQSLQKEIVAFDRGGSFEPGTYKLYKVQPAKATGKKQAPGGGTGGGPKKKRPYTFTSNIRGSVIHHD